MRRFQLWALPFVTVAFWLALTLGARHAHAEDSIIRFGVIPLEDKATMYKQFTPLAKYLTKELGVEVKLVIGQDYQATMDALAKNDVQFAYLTPTTYPKCAKQNPDAGIAPLARFLEGGKGVYKSCVIVPANSPVADVKELKGKKFAFGAKDSTSSHLMPRSILLNAGINPDKDLAEVKYVGSHTNVAEAVALGTFDAGGVKDSVANKFAAEKKVKVIATSQDIPEFPVCTNNKVDKALAEKVVAALNKLNQPSDDNKLILTSINSKYTGIEAANGADYDSIRSMVTTIYGESFYNR